MRGKIALAVVLAAALGMVESLSAAARERRVDYRYAPAWQQSATSFPDDNFKTLVGPSGQLLYEYGGRFFPYSLDKGFKTVIQMLADEDQKFVSTSLMSAKIPAVVLDASLGDLAVTQRIYSRSESLLSGALARRPFTSDREDVVYTVVRNTSNHPETITPMVVVNSEHKVSVDGRVVTIGGKERFVMSLPTVRVRGNLADFKTIIELQPVDVPSGGECIVVGAYDNGLDSRFSERLLSDVDETVKSIPSDFSRVCDYWEKESGIPYGHIQVPDKEIQNLLDASVRGIWQAREVVNGHLSLQVGPTCYRGLWIVDGAFLSEVSAMLGCGEDACAGIEYSLSFQNEDGGFAKLNPTFWKENGLILWTSVRHSMLTQDKEWLRSRWDKLSKTVDFIKILRGRTLENDIPEDDGLIPPGYIDGGLAGGKDTPEYSNVLWNLAGLKAMGTAARWIGETEDAAVWSKEYEDFYDAFRKAAARDLATDSFGNRYLHNMMRPCQRDLPQRAQWTFCQSVYPGQVFEAGDSVVIGTMNMLETTLQEGVVMGTGWIPEGIWNYFASFYGHAWLWNGRGDKAADALYAFANHATPMYAWREEHNPRDLQDRYVGDMPHNWSSAEFIRLASHLLQIDRGDSLHLLEGIPAEWLGPGMRTEINEMATPFGPLSFSLEVDSDGRKARLSVKELSDNCSKIVVHTSGWGSVRGKDVTELSPERENVLTIKLIRNKS